MATAPTVQTLDQIMAELQPSVQGQVGVINQQKAANAAVYDAQRAGLDAQKVKGFNDINTQATGRGMAFSGIPLNEQAEYLSTKYLPGIQAANAQQNMDALAYDRQAADLNANIFNRAFDWRNQQVLTLNDWNKMLSGQEFSRSERLDSQSWQTSERKDSQSFTAGESQKDRDFTASQNAMNRAAQAAARVGSGGGSGGGGGTTTAKLSQGTLDAVNRAFKGQIGADGHSNPTGFKNALGVYLAGGGSAADFYSEYSKYINTKHASDYMVKGK